MNIVLNGVCVFKLNTTFDRGNGCLFLRELSTAELNNCVPYTLYANCRAWGDLAFCY